PPMLLRRLLTAAVACLGVAAGTTSARYLRTRAAEPIPLPGAAGPFLVKPYLQLGDAPALSHPERAALVWPAGAPLAARSVGVRAGGREAGRRAAPPAARRVALPGVAPFRIYTANLAGLPPGGEFDYRVLKEGEPVFAAAGRARRAVGQPYR